MSISVVGIYQLKSRPYRMLTVLPFKKREISSGEHAGSICIIRHQAGDEDAHSDKRQIKISVKILAGVK